MTRAFAIGLLLALSSSIAVADDKQKLVGTWKLVSLVSEYQDTGDKRAMFGESPRGYIVYTAEGRLILVLTSDKRGPANTPEEMAQAYRSMSAYSGLYRVEGDKLTTKIDVSWAEAWVGPERTSIFKIEGSRLHITGTWGTSALRPGSQVRNVSVWEREKSAPSQ